MTDIHPEPQNPETADAMPDITEASFGDGLAERIDRIRGELGKIIEGQEHVIEELLTAFTAGGHVLLEGVPGVAKTLTVRALAAALNLSFSRIQFTPDLMPADVTGVSIFEAHTGEFRFKKGPVFADILLADEINRAPAKTQASLLEAMQERQVTIDGVTHPLPDHFMVIATQNPLEYEGTYPLPEAQLDRFLMKVMVDYPAASAELAMLATMNRLGDKAHNPTSVIEKTINNDDVTVMRETIHQVEVDEAVLQYIVNLVRKSREMPILSVGASPRSSVMLLHASKALSRLRGNKYVRPDEVREVAPAVLRHRITLTPEAQIEGLTPDACIEQLLKQVTVPR